MTTETVSIPTSLLMSLLPQLIAAASTTCPPAPAAPAPDASSPYDSFIGKRVLIRGYSSGLFIGTLTAAKYIPEKGMAIVEVKDLRRIYSWSGALETCDISANGITEGKVSRAVSRALVPDAQEIFELSPDAESKIVAQEKTF